MTETERVRPYAEHLAETKALRRARRDEDKSQRRIRWTEEGFSEREQVEGVVFNTEPWTVADVADEGPNGGIDPSVSEIWLNGPNRFTKVYTSTARKFAATEGMASEMRLWFAALDRADSAGHAIFEPSELEAVMGCNVQVIQRAIRKGKALGLVSDMTNSRHIWLIGVEDGSAYGRRLATARFIRGDGYPAPATGHGMAA